MGLHSTALAERRGSAVAMSGHREPRWSEFDASIRETARALWLAGFEPLNGHGRETALAETGMAIQDMVMRCDPAQLLAEADRLQALVTLWGLPAETEARTLRVEGSYDPHHRSACLILLGVQDDMLPAAVRCTP